MGAALVSQLLKSPTSDTCRFAGAWKANGVGLPVNFLFCDDVVSIFILSILIVAVWFRRRGRAKPPAPLHRSGDADLDLLRPGFLVLHQMHLQHTVFEVGGDFGRGGVIREREAAAKAAVSALDAVILLAVFFLLVFAVARDGERAGFHRDFDVLFLPFGHPQGFLVALGPVDLGAAEQAAQGVLQVFQLFKLIPTCCCIHISISCRRMFFETFAPAHQRFERRRYILIRNNESGLGKCLASIWRPGAGGRALKNCGFSPEPAMPEPGYWNETNQGDDDKNIHSNTFYLTAIFPSTGLQSEDEFGYAHAIETGSFI